MSKRPSKVKLEIVAPPSHLKFVDSIGHGTSVYIQKLLEALNAGRAIQIVASDHYMRSQLRQAAVKLKLKLLYALDGDALYVKPVQIEGELKRLVLLLRERRTLAELQSKKLELHLDNSLTQLAKDGIAHAIGDKWVLTEKGLDTLA